MHQKITHIHIGFSCILRIDIDGRPDDEYEEGAEEGSGKGKKRVRYQN